MTSMNLARSSDAIQGGQASTSTMRKFANTYKLDPVQQSKQRLSYDGRTIPASELRQHNLVDIPTLQVDLQGIVTRLSRAGPGEMPTLQVKIIDSYSSADPADPFGDVFVPLGMLDNVES